MVEVKEDVGLTGTSAPARIIVIEPAVMKNGGIKRQKGIH